MLVLDKRFGLAFFYNWKRTALTIASGLAVFIAWDVVGIVLGIFFTGDSHITTGIMVAPEFPLEEFFFLFFLCYFALIVYRLLEKSWRRI